MITAVVLIKTEREKIVAVAETLSDIAGVSEVYSVAGRYDLVAMLRVRKPEEMARLVTSEIGKVAGIVETETLVAFRAYSRHDLGGGVLVGLRGVDRSLGTGLMRAPHVTLRGAWRGNVVVNAVAVSSTATTTLDKSVTRTSLRSLKRYLEATQMLSAEAALRRAGAITRFWRANVGPHGNQNATLTVA